MQRLLASQQRLDEWVGELGDDDMRRPSALPDWSIGHVLSHIALNAEAFTNVARGVAAGEVGVMYPRGYDARNREIAEGATRSPAVIRTHIERSSADFAAAWSALDEEAVAGSAIVFDGMPQFAANTIVLRRLREVEVHQSDCGLGSFRHDHWSDGYVDWDLPTQWPSVADRLDRGLVVVDERGDEHAVPGDEPQRVEVERRDLLAWTMNRAQPEALPTIGSWQ